MSERDRDTEKERIVEFSSVFSHQAAKPPGSASFNINYFLECLAFKHNLCKFQGAKSR